MSVAARVQHAFRSLIRERGRAYQRGGFVALDEVCRERVTADVLGSAPVPYRVELRPIAQARRTGLGASCTCPHFARGEACKHVFATILELDAEGVRLPDVERSAARRLPLIDLDLDGGEEFDLDETVDDAEAFVGKAAVPRLGTERMRRRSRSAAPVPDSEPGRGVPNDTSWQIRLLEIASARPWYRSLGAGSGSSALARSRETPLLYLLDPDRLREAGRVVIQFARASLRRDGTPGPLRPARLAPEDLQDAPGARESALRAQLLQLVQAHAALGGYGYASHSGASGRVVLASSVEIPVALADPLLARLAETGRLGLAPKPDGSAPVVPCWLRFEDEPPWQLRVELRGVEAGAEGDYELRGRFVRGDETLAIGEPSFLMAAGFLIHGTTLARADCGGDIEPWRALRAAPVRIPAVQIDEAIARLASLAGLPPLDLGAEVPYREVSVPPTPRLRLAGLDPDAHEVEARLEFRYGARWLSFAATATRVADATTRTLLARDRELEAQALAVLEALGFRVAAEPHAAAWEAERNDDRESTSTLRLPIASFEPAAHELLAKGWLLEVDGAPLRAPGRSSAQVRSGIDFFDLEGGVSFDDTLAPFPALLAAVRDGERFVRLADGSRGLLPRAWLARCVGLAGVAADEGDHLRFRRSQASLLAALLAAQDDVRADRRFAALRRRLASFSGIDPLPEPAGFSGTLREYQRFGLGWLAFLERFGLGGCLADDMGLGKTVQVLAHLSARAGRRSRRRGRRPSLVVAPRSVLHGWREEAQRFAPALRVLAYDGPDRAALRGRFGDADLVVATYGTMRRDIEVLREQRFDYVILDEAQAIKNGGSRTAKAARLLRAEQRLALTGTPIENHLGELASLFEFLNPGMLGRARGLSPLAAGTRDPEQMALLARALRPFLLRRTKSEVLSELPAKTEQTLLCELPPAQRREYDELRRHYQSVLSERVARVGIERSKLHVLEALLRLRQAACHPALIDPDRAGEPSAKLTTLFEQLDEVLEEGHKALVFSQFTRLLALVRDRVEARGIDHAYLDGRTRDRPARIARFQEDPACRLFLVSLKAGGTGLNLTAADYVFLLDPWWNPAVEAQAIDRAHRIGQPRPVFAYRLVARDTVEEKILALQQRKRTLAETILGPGEQSLIGGLSAEDLGDLLG
jgi:superfamily II DNA or RNA helicase